MADAIIVFDGADPFMHTVTARLWSSHDARFGTLGKDRDGLVELSEAEFSLMAAWRRWRAILTDLLKASEDCEPLHGEAPHPYSNHFVVKNKQHYVLLHEAEWIVSAILDACYALCERITETTRRINRRSVNTVWSDIEEGKGKRAVERKLLELFGNEKGEAEQHVRTAIVELVTLRGKRTHSMHLYCHVEREPVVAIFQDTTPYSGVHPSFTVSSVRVEEMLSGLVTFLRWWAAFTHDQLTHL